MHACGQVSVEPVFLAAPGTSDARLAAVAAAARGFVYCVGAYGVTGERERLEVTAAELVARLRPITDRPLMVGVGIGTPEQAAAACTFADGVIVGSALVKMIEENSASPDLVATAAEFVKALKQGVLTAAQ